MLKRLPSLNNIKVFEATARLGSFKAAAYELNVSPTAISHQISELEKELGIKLFIRGFRIVTLTEEGQKLAEVSTRLISELKQTLLELTTYSNKITISTTNAFAAMWLVPQLHAFKVEYPDTEVQIKADDDLIDIDQELGVDMVIRYGFADINNAQVRKITNDQFGLFATQQYWRDREEENSDVKLLVTQWKNKDLLRYHQPEALLQQFGQERPTFEYFEDENQVIQAALAGQGVAYVSKILVQQTVTQGWLLESPSFQIESMDNLCYYSVIPKRSLNHPSVIAFQNWIMQRLATV
ncbi:LysR family transcriptional regulator [Acinetobacter haemolyticus]|uniref:LysR family transcriptional regulator n=1 Tax=Acinetobacter haemolyticus TaxID=29430 RepID=UPI0021CD30CF|nr:LysR family transcriptional regulator [Acinetobacter haemolyticus]MCU4377510.1 LysR family transcriptional regulator [Acinetobacter haemolyticus]